METSPPLAFYGTMAFCSRAARTFGQIARLAAMVGASCMEKHGDEMPHLFNDWFIFDMSISAKPRPPRFQAANMFSS